MAALSVVAFLGSFWAVLEGRKSDIVPLLALSLASYAVALVTGEDEE